MAQKNDDNSWLVGLTIIAGFLIAWLAYDRNRTAKLLERKQDENDDLNRDNDVLVNANKILLNKVGEYENNLAELKKMVEETDHIEDAVKKKITSLIDTYKGVDPRVSNELTAAMALIDAKQPTKAVFSLAKIVENLLKEKYSNDPDFLKEQKKKNPSFHDYLEFAKNDNLLEPEEYHFAKGLKEIRNQEGHEMDVKKSDGWLHTAFFTGLGLILKLGEVLNR